MGRTFLSILILAWILDVLTFGAFWGICAAWVAARFAERHLRGGWVSGEAVEEIKRDNVRLQQDLLSAARERETLKAAQVRPEEFAAAVRQARVQGQHEILRLFEHDRGAFTSLFNEFAARYRSSEGGSGKEGPKAREERTGPREWWDVLGVSKDAPLEEVRGAFRALARRHHPDNRETGDAARMKEINAAWEQAERRVA